MKRILLIIVFSVISYVSTAQLELVLSLLQSVNIGRVNEVKNTILSGGMVTFQAAEIIDAVKVLKKDKPKGFDYLPEPVATEPFIIPIDLTSSGYKLKLRM